MANISDQRLTAMDSGIKRLQWGCGRSVLPGWINSDRRIGKGIDLSCDLTEGFPLSDNSIDYIASVHALQEIAYPDLIPALQELRRVLKVNGVLRLVLPDLDKGIRAYSRADRDYFLIPDEDSKSIGGKFIIQLLWYGHSRSLFTYDFIKEILYKAGFVRVSLCDYKKTESLFSDIVEVDNREQESLFVEAVK